MPAVLQVFYNVILPVFMIAGLGYLFGKRFHPNPSVFSRVSLYIFLPALVFQNLTTSEVPPGDLGRLTLLAVLVTAVHLALAVGLSRAHAALGRPTQASVIMCAVLVNAGNLGIPLIDFAFGAAGNQIGIVIALLQTIIIYTLGVYLASSGSASMLGALRNVLSTPLPYAVVLGLFVRATELMLPAPLLRTVTLLGQATVPLLLVLLGVQLASVRLHAGSRLRVRALVAVTVYRLAVTPFIVWLLTALLGIGGLAQQVAIVQYSLPVAVNAALLAMEFGSDAEFSSAAIVLSTLASLLSLSVLLPLMLG